MRYGEKDYLLPCDGNPHPEGIEETAIPLSYTSNGYNLRFSLKRSDPPKSPLKRGT
jgi:hypothetical protein